MLLQPVEHDGIHFFADLFFRKGEVMESSLESHLCHVGAEFASVA